MFPYPGSPGYARQWGAPDDEAWERAMDHYLARFDAFSDVQNARPLPLCELEEWTSHNPTDREPVESRP
jgi:hypothetical protein